MQTLQLLCVAGNLPKRLQIFPRQPSLQKGIRNVVSSYRPVAVICNPSRIFESIIYKRLQSFLTKSGGLANNQFGCRKSMSTEVAIFGVMVNLLPAPSEKNLALYILLDYCTSSDTLYRNILLGKFYRYGTRGISHDLHRPYSESWR